MNPPHVLLVEDLDAAGAEIQDVRERAAALREAGAEVRALALHRDPATEPGARSPSALPSQTASATRVTRLRPGADGLASLARIAREGSFDLAFLASAREPNGRVARALPRSLKWRWLRTGFAGAPPWFARRRGADFVDAVQDAVQSATTIDPERKRPGRLPLWDGDYLLVPAPLGGRAGAALLEAFADVEDDGLDLVVLSPPQAEFEGLAADLGVGMRLHFVGRAPREAEWAWWNQALAGVAAGPEPLSCGMVLRALAAGCPWTAPAPAGGAAALARWLEAQGLAVAPANEPFATTLERVLERDPGVARAIARGREVAAAHTTDTLPHRLGARLDPGRSAEAA